MQSIPPGDDVLGHLLGSSLPSELSGNVSYRIVSSAGAGPMFAAYYALRVGPDGEVPVVTKVLRPSFVRQFGPTASLVVKKEAVALGRLNERVPPTPFVVRLIDTGTLQTRYEGQRLELPWVAIEYVHGGAQGTTLAQRVQSTIETTGHAFHPSRAARLVECLTSGISAVHEVGVIHRDISPSTVLCSGAGEDEVFKITDFGLARPTGLKGTLVAGLVGTLGAAAPEVLANEQQGIGPWSDVFSLASIIYFVLTGEPYFVASSKGDALLAALQPGRRSVLEGELLHPLLRGQEHACRSIDFVLGWASAGKPEDRLQEAPALAAMLLPHLRAAPVLELPPHGEAPGPLTARRPSMEPAEEGPPAVLASRDPGTGSRPSSEATTSRVSVFGRSAAASPAGSHPVAPAEPPRETRSVTFDDEESDDGPPTMRRPSMGLDLWSWSTLHHPGSVGVIRSVAWDGYGRCLAATSDGLSFWNGTSWSPASVEGLPAPTGVRLVRRIGPGRWLIGGDASTLAIYTTGGVNSLVQLPGGMRRYVNLSGDLEELAVLVSESPERPIHLHAFAGRKWLKPLALPEVLSVAALAPVGDDRWLVAGRSSDGGGYAAVYSPLEWDIERIATPVVRAFLCCAGDAELGAGLVAGSAGAVSWRIGGRIFGETLDKSSDLSAVALDPDGTAWAAGAGKIWLRRRGEGDGAHPPIWDRIWSDGTFVAPIVSLFTEPGVVVAMTADGGIVEGRTASA